MSMDPQVRALGIGETGECPNCHQRDRWLFSIPLGDGHTCVCDPCARRLGYVVIYQISKYKPPKCSKCSDTGERYLNGRMVPCLKGCKKT